VINISWQAVPNLWQQAFRLAWQTYREGSNPIAALIADASGTVITTGKSAVRADISEVPLNCCEIAHAELNALMQLDNRVHDKSRASGYTLYSTMEPCPLCMSALYMSDVESLHYASRDAFAGSVNLLGATPYFSRKHRRVSGPVAGLAEISIFLNVYFDIAERKLDAETDPVHDAFATDYPDTVAIARALAPSDQLKLRDIAEFEPVFARIAGARLPT